MAVKKYILKNIGKSLNNKVNHNFKKEIPLMQYILAYESGSKMELIRDQMIRYALKHGNEAAAEKYECHRNTVSKWKNRHNKEGSQGLKDRSRAPHNIPHKIIDPKRIKAICAARDEEGYGSFRLKMEYGFEESNMTINRILGENGKIEESGTKEQQKQDLWQVKQAFKTLETKLQLDGKYLLDIPNYLFYYKLLGLPKWQFTLRCVKSGATFLGFADTEDGLNACTFITYVFEHFVRHGIDPSTITIQTDGASYAFSPRSLKITAFRELIEQTYGAKLKVVPQGGTRQSDVETFHSLVEPEFYKRKSFSSVADFYAQIYRYLYKFNYIRKNSHKNWKAPVYFLNQDRPNTPVEVLDLPPINLSAHPEIYWCKINPKHITHEESVILDLHPDELPCSDFSHDEYLDHFVKRVLKGYNETGIPAHDLPIYPSRCL
jgi:transposase